ncbi:hypothetical protein JQX09_19890 [Sulfitobacter pseudonitzschiae]|uniref:Uncharacterized protein n=1 Tax=Pseudosulfitobacter pseudonitzschiae TaxID=1402135 RepID=A0A9Q2RU83_9RHOB|nr:hypothetical protein [Pseudosulfitobacter pseudonitzschiae]MBM2294193.1 hypothetical protein [Pseudosulfitobacter pseudonitzschiae]MBM2299117.1 hypothetical protein [Pseudosulfitobacter pseudonitzschiae]MBM2304025.1 hypothetical protein [Pseudosulfitobacter pseudonitzschiae]MBM2313806.1 hypothetical protein [Pseudosulfitobacter pseudonitzschiae]MBM2318721.1 hypothetical protein [Pseudosulfitobacter pseudonitzschiae]
MKFEFLLKNTAFGMLLGLLIAFSTAAIIDTTASSQLRQNAVYLISAVTTLIAATLAIVGVLSNIQTQRELEAKRRHRKFLSVKSVFPNALSDACDVFERGIRLSTTYELDAQEAGIHEHNRATLKKVRIPADVTNIFRDIIEFTDDDQVAERVSGLLREYQVALARWRSLSDENLLTTETDIRMRTVFWAYLYAITASLFDIARGNSSRLETKVTATEISTAIGNVTHEGDFDAEIGLYARTFERRFETHS